MNLQNNLEQNQLKFIDQVDVWTPKNVKVSSVLMEDVISTLQKEEDILLEHINDEVRVVSLLCSSLAWLKHKQNQTNSEKSKKLKIVYASQDETQLKQAEGYIQKTIYRPKITYFKEGFDFQQIKEYDLIFITKECLINYEQDDFKNSILIFDSQQCFQKEVIQITISESIIKKAEDESLILASNIKQLDNSSQDLQQLEQIKESIQYFYKKINEFQFKNPLQKNAREDYNVVQEIEQYLTIRAMNFNQYVKSCSEMLKQSDIFKLDSLSLWFKFIKLTFQINKQIYKGYCSSTITQRKEGKSVFINLKYYSQYFLDHLKKLQFQSIILSSKLLFSTYDYYLNKIQIKHKIDRSQYFQSFYLESNDQNLSLFMTLNSIQKAIPNSVLVIFKLQKDIKKFQEYCQEQQSSILKEIEKNKKLFWPHQKYNSKHFIASQRQGAILFETQRGIFKKDFDSPNSFQFCNGLILVGMNKPCNYNEQERQYQDEKSLKYFQNLSFNKLIERTLLQENNNKVLIIYDKKSEILEWINVCDICQLNCFEFDNPFFIQMIEQQFQGQQLNIIEIEKESDQNNQQIPNRINKSFETQQQCQIQQNIQDDEMDLEDEDSPIFEFTFQN